MNNGENSIEQLPVTFASKNSSMTISRLEITATSDTGRYRGRAHRSCNLRYKIPKYIPIVFHNLSRYDAHLFIRELGKKFSTGKIGVIAENKENTSALTFT